MRVTEKLQETDREYELSLQAIAEKEKSLGQKSESLNLLQKQVRHGTGAARWRHCGLTDGTFYFELGSTSVMVHLLLSSILRALTDSCICCL